MTTLLIKTPYGEQTFTGLSDDMTIAIQLACDKGKSLTLQDDKSVIILPPGTLSNSYLEIIK